MAATGERRSHFRGKSRPGRRVEVSFTTAAGTHQRAYTKNIGVGGAFIVTDTQVPPGTTVSFTIHVPTSTIPLEVLGEVRWASNSPLGMGVRFSGVGADGLLVLSEYFASLTGRDE